MWKLSRPIRRFAKAMRRDRRTVRKQAQKTDERDRGPSVGMAPETTLSIGVANEFAVSEESLEQLLQRGQTSQQNKTELLRECVREFRNVKWNVKVLGHHLAYRLARQLPSVSTVGMPTRIGLKSKACVQEDVESAWFAYWAGRLRATPIYHRKLWEYCYILQALFDAGALTPGARGLGFGCGAEPLPSLFASMGISVTATDAPPAVVDAGWVASGQHSHSLEALYMPHLCNRANFDQLVSLTYVDMNHIPISFSGGFDFTWSACALEHLGSIANGLTFIEESLHCLKPGGIAVHTTEWNFSNEEETLDNAGTVLFQLRHFEKLAQDISAKGFLVAPLDFSVGSGLLDRFIDVPPYEGSQDAHLRLAVAGFPSTSFGIIVTRAS